MEQDKKRQRLDPALEELKAAKDAKVPIVRLLASPDSFTFEEKVVRVTDTLIIGRSNLAHFKNGLFDCPQVSATHASINYNDSSFTIILQRMRLAGRHPHTCKNKKRHEHLYFKDKNHLPLLLATELI